jgi:3-methyladenine DNA glycosylase AlkD
MAASADEVIAALAAEADPVRAAGLRAFFKTGPGQYGEGDRFIGLTVPAMRRLATRFPDLPQEQIDALLDSGIHEHRFVGLAILVSQSAAAPEVAAAHYLAAVRRGRVNNWDLVDSSAEFVLGAYLYDRPRDLLFELARGESVWERRVAIIATFCFIKRGDASTTLAIAAILLDDRHDLIHKAVGWMLREVGKRVDPALLLRFLDENAARMPRTALSYAMEHLDPERRAHYRALR